MQALITLAAFIATLGLLVSFHEFGHFLAARCCGVRVLRFAVGFGKPIVTYHAKNKTEWVLASIPLGGYVKLLDGRDAQQKITPEEELQSFDKKPLWQRSLIVAADPLANFFLAVILFAMIYMSGAPQLPAVLQVPPESSVAAEVGLVEGDRVIGWQKLEADSDPVHFSGEFDPVPSWNALRWLLIDAVTAGDGFSLEIQAPTGGRFTKAFLVADLPLMTPEKDPLMGLGVLPKATPFAEWQILQLGPLQALFYASQRVWLISKVSTRLMMGIFTGKTSVKQLGGPLSIAEMAGKTAQVGWQPFLAFLALMSISIGISIGLLNLAPFPMLDGGQLLYDAWELVAGKADSDFHARAASKSGLLAADFPVPAGLV